MSKGEVEKSFDYFRLLQLSYLPVDNDVYALLRGKIKDAFIELVNNKTSLPEVGTLSIQLVKNIFGYIIYNSKYNLMNNRCNYGLFS